jgi:transglutaminase-like putative cysteine protease
MIFEVTAELDYAVRFRSAMILSFKAQRSASQIVRHERFDLEPSVATHEYTDDNGNRFLRLDTGTANKLDLSYAATVECDVEMTSTAAIAPTPVAALDDAAIPYLFPSRYCQSDRLGKLAWDLFGKLEKPIDKVHAINAWIYENVEYLRGSTTSVTSAYDTVTQRAGVCRDFAHLAIALCRALNIPARYFTGYAYELQPPDFHACYECHIGGQWLVFDATRLAHLNGLVRIAIGRDAADTAVASVFGAVVCSRMKVDCRPAAGETFKPIPKKQLAKRAIALTHDEPT